MITKIKVENFKKLVNAEFNITQPVSLFVGQNNGGKTTALQAISLWSFLISQWKLKKGGGSAKKRVGAPITRSEIHPAPVLEIANLWTEGQVREKGKTSENIRIKVTLGGINDATGAPWEYGVEATFGNKELLYASPIDVGAEIPLEVGKVFHLPPLSGVQTEEPKSDPGAQLRAIGEGRPGEILRNLLLELHENRHEKWEKLVKATKDLFAIDLLPIKYNSGTDPYIHVYYYSSLSQRGRQQYQTEISSAGSGFLQFLLIASFLLSHENAILLIDEPDSHMHVFLQRSIFEWVQSISIEEKAQVIISTHSEVLINSSGIEKIVTFFGLSPKPLRTRNSELISALSEASPLSIVHAEWKKRIIYVEGESDIKLLKTWAGVLNHPVKKLLPETFFYVMGSNNIVKAKKHFQALQVVIDGAVKGFVLRDGNVRETTGLPNGLMCEYWELPEIENYLMHPQSLIRFVENFGLGGLFGAPKRAKAEECLANHLTPAYFSDPHSHTSDFGRNKGSDFLSEFFKKIDITITKSDYWRIAQIMNKAEVYPEVKKILDKIKIFLD